MKDLNIEKAYNLVLNKVEGWAETLITMLPNIVVALLVLLVFVFIASGAKKLAKNLSKKVSENIALNELISNILYILIIGVGIFTALSILQLDRALTSLLTGAGIIGLALSFAFQDTASNFISGIFLAIRKPLNVGDIVETKDVMGEVKEMSLRNTMIKSFQGQYIYVPNKEVFQNKLINFSQPGIRRVDLPVGVSYGDNLSVVEEKAVSAINELEFVIKNEETSFVFEEFGSSSINGKLMFWIDYPGQKSYLTARSKAIQKIKSTFDKEDISIPFPIRTLDFGIKGGEKLSAMMDNEKQVSKNNS